MLRACVIEFEPLSGDKVRIQWKAAAPPETRGMFKSGVHQTMPANTEGIANQNHKG
jgi:hypothetical protein